MDARSKAGRAGISTAKDAADHELVVAFGRLQGAANRLAALIPGQLVEIGELFRTADEVRRRRRQLARTARGGALLAGTPENPDVPGGRVTCCPVSSVDVPSPTPFIRNPPDVPGTSLSTG